MGLEPLWDLFPCPLKGRPCPGIFLCAPYTKRNGFKPDQNKQIKVIYYNIKLFVILLNQKRTSNIKKLDTLRLKSCGGWEMRARTEVSNPISEARAHPEREAEYLGAEPEIQMSKKGFVNTKHFKKFLRPNRKWRTSAVCKQWKQAGKQLRSFMWIK